MSGADLIDVSVVEATLDAALRTGGEFAEVFVEDKRASSAYLDDGKVEELTSGRDRGRASAPSSARPPASPIPPTCPKPAARRCRSRGGGCPLGWRRHDGCGARAPGHRPWLRHRDLPGRRPQGHEGRVAHPRRRRARTQGAAITQVSASYADSRRRILVANSDGLLAGDDTVRTLFSVSCVATGDTGMQTGRESVGYTVGFELFDQHDVAELARRAADRALTKLAARPAPSGELPVVIGPGGGGVLFHEACGHGLEADLVAKGASVFRGRVGDQVASPLVTLVDDGTMAKEWGNIGIDDEGHPAARNVLIQDGVLTDYMWDLLRARKEGRPSSGNGRRQSYQHLPMVRMTNTYLLAGTDDPDEIVASTPNGVYIAHLGGGSVNTATGDFVFGMTEAYLIEDGRITEPLREGNLIGNGPEVLQRIDAVGNDFAMGSPGTCGKDGQGVPVGDGVPTLRVSSLTVGGTAA
ncbi:MAG: TldD/PmbA family protein [Acidimicrobiales bacterium]